MRKYYFYADPLQNLQVFLSWSEDMHVVIRRIIVIFRIVNFVIAYGTLRVAGSSVFLFLVSICDLRHFRRL